MDFIEEGIDLWLKIVIFAVLLIVPSALYFYLIIGGEVASQTGNGGVGGAMEVTGKVIGQATTIIGNILLAIFLNPITILLCIGFVFYMKYVRK